jgi:hypothetical protein
MRTLVWPCVAVTALILFRRQLGAFIPRIREISAAGASVRFGEQAIRLADEADRLVQGVVGGQAAAAHQMPELLRPEPVADPAVVCLEAYRELEATAKEAGPAADVAAATPVPVIRGLASRGQVPQEAVRVAEDLRRIRNEVAHGASAGACRCGEPRDHCPVAGSDLPLGRAEAAVAARERSRPCRTLTMDSASPRTLQWRSMRCPGNCALSSKGRAGRPTVPSWRSSWSPCRPAIHPQPGAGSCHPSWPAVTASASAGPQQPRR